MPLAAKRFVNCEGYMVLFKPRNGPPAVCAVMKPFPLGLVNLPKAPGMVTGKKSYTPEEFATTVTVKLHEPAGKPLPSRTVQVTVVVPAGKVEPEGGVKMTVAFEAHGPERVG